VAQEGGVTPALGVPVGDDVPCGVGVAVPTVCVATVPVTAGVLPPGKTRLSSPQPPAAMTIAQAVAAQNRARLALTFRLKPRALFGTDLPVSLPRSTASRGTPERSGRGPDESGPWRARAPIHARGAYAASRGAFGAGGSPSCE